MVSSHNQSPADLGSRYPFARQMKLFPFSLQDIIKLSVIVAAPMLPLVMPIEEILKVLAKALL